MPVSSSKQGLVIVGGGPAGLATLFAAANAGRLDDLLRLGVTVLERGEVLGCGAIGNYTIGSDSSAEALTEIVLASRHPVLGSLRMHPVTQALAGFGKGSAPLKLVGEFLHLAGRTICGLVQASKRGRVITSAKAVWVEQTSTGTWRTKFVHPELGLQTIESTSVVLASGAEQPAHRLRTELVAGVSLDRYSAKLLQSGQVLADGGAAEVERRLHGLAQPRVVVAGGSTSAAAVSLMLLTRLPEIGFAQDGVTLLHRSPLRIFYETVDAALADGYTEFTANDICPLSGRVFRLSGFRLDSRELIMRARGIAGRPPEPRLRLLQITSATEQEAQAALAEADLIVAALGYRPRLLPVFDSSMRPIPVLEPGADRWSVVDESCRVLTSAAVPLPGLFAIGLAVGPAANRQFGGEADFRGQVNSLWLWQHVLGKIIAEQVLAGTEQDRQPVPIHLVPPLAAARRHPDTLANVRPNPFFAGVA